MLKFGDAYYMTDDDLTVNILGFWPQVAIQNKKLKEIYEKEFKRGSLGGDDLISYAQPLVSRGMNFNELELEILEDIENPEKPGIKEILFNKTATGIGRGHSLGGLSGIVFGIHGTKMIDSGLTGLCTSRSLVTSSRRRETGTSDIVIPNSLRQHPELLKEYMQISEEVFNLGNEFKEKFGKLEGVETFNKVIPYNNPADLFIVLPLDTMATIISETREDKLNPNGNYLPREIWKFAEMLLQITEKAGQSIMLKQRIEVPRDTYFHYNLFKDPSKPNSALERGLKTGMSTSPIIESIKKDVSPEIYRALENLKRHFEKVKVIENPEELHQASLKLMYHLREISSEYNDFFNARVIDSLSWRVWSEQKRHATLRQNVESVYSAADRALINIEKIWLLIEQSYQEKSLEKLEPLLNQFEKNIIIDNRLKKKPEIIFPYVYHTARQLIFYKKMLKNEIEQRDALYIVPKNIRVRTLENYDLVNLINLEFPLRLCGTCEPERQVTSWNKRKAFAEAFPELSYFLQPKCNIGFCTEGKICGYMNGVRRNYYEELHKRVKQTMLDKAK